jgi:hypothetical protein
MMKKIFLMYSIVLMAFTTYSQNEKQREIGLAFSIQDNLGIRYKTGKSDKLFRFTLLDLSKGLSTTTHDSSTLYKDNFGIGLNIGYEIPRTLNDKLKLYYGPELLTSYSNSINETTFLVYKNNQLLMSAGVGLILGIRYFINQSINISAELVPAAKYSYTETTLKTKTTPESVTKTDQLGLAVNNNTATVTIGVRF